MSTEKAGLCPPGIPLRGQVTAAALQAALKLGAANGRSVEALAAQIDTTPRGVRKLRKLREELVAAGVPVCAHPKHGYFIAATRAEVDANYNWLRGRGLHELALASQLSAAFNDGGVDPIAQLETEGVFDL